MSGLTLAITFRLPRAGVTDFQHYEDRVLPLLAEHGGALQRRLRSSDGTFELHLVHFESRDGLERYRQDPRRGAHAPLLAASGARVETIEVEDVR